MLNPVSAVTSVYQSAATALNGAHILAAKVSIPALAALAMRAIENLPEINGVVTTVPIPWGLVDAPLRMLLNAMRPTL